MVQLAAEGRAIPEGPLSYKTKADAIRAQDEGAYRGGRLEQDAPKPPRPRYPCFAEGCPMPGTIFPGVIQGGTGDSPGTCAWHYGLIPNDIPRVTQLIREWECVAREIDRARRVHTGPLACDPAALQREFDAAVARLRPAVQSGGWGNTFEREGMEGYGRWAQRLEVFLGKRVRELLQPQHWRQTHAEGRQPAVDEELPWR